MLMVLPCPPQVNFPALYEDVVLFTGLVFNLDFLNMVPMECVNKSVNYYYTLVFYTLVPLAVAMLLLLANCFLGTKIDLEDAVNGMEEEEEEEAEGAEREKEKKKGTKAYFNAFLLVTYLALVPVSTKIFYMLRCDHFEELDTDYLSLDMRLICRVGNQMTPTYSLMYIFALIMMLIYVRSPSLIPRKYRSLTWLRVVQPLGIPAMYACLLWRAREQLYPRLKDDPNANTWQLFIRHASWNETVEETEEQETETHPLDFLASPYEGHVFWCVASSSYVASELVPLQV